MAQITSREELEEWLKDKPADWAQVIAARAALRVLPYAFTKRVFTDWVIDHSNTLFRTLAISWSASNFPSSGMIFAAIAAESSYTFQAEYTTDVGRFPSDAYIADDVAIAAARAALAASKPDIVFRAATASAIAAYRVAGAPLWSNIRYDCFFLQANVGSTSVVRSLLQVGLWPDSIQESWWAAWDYAANRLLTLDHTYQVWIDWYNRRIEGHDAAFDIPGDTDRAEDKKILTRLADATNDDFWGKGTTYVNTTLQGWIDEARERVRPSETPDAPPPPTPEAIRAVAAEIASPTVTLTNNQLDVTTNTAFDGQSDAANLDEAIAVLRAVVGALLGGLPGNAPRSFVANLTIYDGELAKRDAKPFLGVLVRMEKSVSAGFHADPEIFDVGVTTNFESYFEAHLAFMTHYRRNEEREAKIAQFSIDDAAASGVALTGPVDEVVKEVDALAEQGLVTDGFVQAIKEQQAINYEVALYTASMPTISGEPSVKKRLILQIVGILERALAVVNNLVSATAQFGAFVKVVKQAIAELLKFFV